MSLHLPGFEILERIGAGAFSQVFRVRREVGAEDEALRLENAPRSPEADAPRLDPGVLPRHPHLLRALQWGVDPRGRHWQLFPLVRPRDASTLVDAHGPPVALALLCQAASGLAALHLSGIHHGDVSRENLLVQDTGNADPWEVGFLHIADFGASEAIALGSDSPGTLTGTLGYVPPEALASRVHRSTAADDVFGLGAWLCWLISGSELLRGESLADTLERYRSPRPLAARLLATRPKFQTKFWSDLVETLVHEDAAQRPESAVQLTDWLRERVHLVPEFDARLPRLLWNPFGLTPDEAEACSRLKDLAGSPGSRRVRVSGVDPGRLPEFVAEASRLLRVASNDVLFISRTDPLEAAVERIQSGRQRLLILDRASAEPDDRAETLHEAWKYQTVGESMDAQQRLAVEFAPSSRRPVGPISSPGHEDQPAEIVIGAGGSGASLDWLGRHFSGAPVDPVFTRQIESKGSLSQALIIELVRAALGSGDVRVDLTGIRIEDDRVEDLLDRLLEPGRVLLESISPRARAFLFALGVGGDELARDLGSTRFPLEGTWMHAIGELLDAGLVDRHPSTGVPLVRLGVHWPRLLGAEEQRALSSLGRAILAGGRDDIGGHTRRLARYWSDQGSALALRGALAVAQSSFLKADVGKASRILDLEPPPAASGYWRARWHERRACVESAMERVADAIPLFDSAVVLFLSVAQNRWAAYVCLKHADLLGDTGRILESIETLQRGHRLIEGDAGQSAHRLRSRLEAEIAFRSRKGGRSPEAASMAEALLALRPKDAGARAIALKVLSDALYRRDLAAEARSLMAAAVVEGRRSGSPHILARVLLGAASYEFSHGRYSRAIRLINRISRLPAVFIGATNRFAAFVALGGIAYESGLLKDALRANVRALAIGRAEGNQRKVQTVAANLSVILADMARPGDAAEMGLASIGSGGDYRSPIGGDPRLKLGDALAYIGDFEALAETVALIGEEDESDRPTAERGRVRYHRGSWLLQQDRRPEARQALALAIEDLQAAGAVDDCLQASIDLFRCDVTGLSAAARRSEIEELMERARRVGNWRLFAQVRLLDLEWNDGHPYEEFQAGLAALERECLERGYLILELPILEARARRQIREGWSADALATLRHAVERVRLIAQGIADERLRRIYLNDSRRRGLLGLIEDARQG